MAPSIESIRSALALLFLWAFVFWAWRGYRVDVFREKLFALRDELFDYASAGNISFDQPAYWMLRKTMNSAIRFAHVFTFTRLTVAILLGGASRTSNTIEQWQNAVNQLESIRVQAKLREFHNRMNLVIFTETLGALVRPILIFYKLMHLRDGRSKHGGTKNRIDDVRRQMLVRRMHLDLLEAQALQAQSEKRKSEELVEV